MRCNIARMGGTICALLLLGTYSARAGLVTMYDGSIGDADPRSQGWILESPDGTPVAGPNPAGFTPDTVNDYVTVNPAVDTDYAYQIDTPLKTALASVVGGDKYVMTMQIQAGSSSDFTKVELLDMITGTSSGSSGYRDRFIMETNLDQPGGPGSGPDRIRMITSGATDLVGDKFFEVGETANFTSLHDMNTLQLVRDGFAFKIYINGDLLYSALGDASGIGGTQMEIRDAGAGTLSDYNLKLITVATVPIPEPSSAVLALMAVLGIGVWTTRR